MKHVKWVTANTRNDTVGVLFGVLTDGKDYKVLEVYDQWEDGFSYAVKTDTGAFQRLHESWFDKPATLKPQPTSCDEIGCDSFDDLVLCVELLEGDYLLGKDLSFAQKGFLQSKLPIMFDTTFTANYVDWEFVNFSIIRGTFAPTTCVNECKRLLTFNNIFKHKSEV